MLSINDNAWNIVLIAVRNSQEFNRYVKLLEINLKSK